MYVNVNPCPERRIPSPNRYIADAKFCFCKNNKRIIIIGENSLVNAMYVNVGYVDRLAERWRANVHLLLNPEE
jgi:hypothetical protein